MRASIAARVFRGRLVPGGAVLVLAVLAGGCATGNDRLRRHADVSIWAEALAAQTDRPSRLLPPAALLVSTPILAAHDGSLSESLIERHAVTGGSTARGDAVAIGLGAAAGGLALWRLADGDDGRTLEIGVESLLVTAGTTELLKRTIRRRRPEGSSNSSFPSGHASFSFAAATFLARSLSESGEGWTRDLGYLAYLPAVYVAINRCEAGRHWPSDVAAGAFLGTLLTGWIHDAHRGGGPEDRPGIFRSRPELVWRVEPELGPDAVGLALVASF